MLHGVIPLDGHVPPADVFSGVHLAHSACVDAQSFSWPDGWGLLVVERDQTRPLAGVLASTCRRLADARAVCEQWPMQAVLLSVEQRSYGGGERLLRVERNASATCPLYALVAEGGVHLHWDGGQLYPLLQSADDLDLNLCRAFLMGEAFYQERTPFKNITRILERGVFEASCAGERRVVRPPALAAPKAQPLVGGADPVAVFHDLLRTALRRWPVTGENTFCELSSGLDTTLVAHLVAQAIHPSRVKTYGYIPLGADAPAIEARRFEAVSRLAALDQCTSVADYFSCAFVTDGSAPYWPFDAPTSFDKHQSARMMARQGGEIVFSGIGGDELCELSEIERAEETATRRFRRVQRETMLPFSLLPDNAAEDVLSPWPPGLVPESVHDVANSIAPLYLRQGVWYAHPLALPEIQIFAHFLPVAWRRGRRLSREILQRMGMSAAFLQQEPKESLSASLDALMTDTSLFLRLFGQSVLIDLKVLDGDKLRTAFSQLREGRVHPRTGFYLLLAFSLECSLQNMLLHRR